MYGEFLPASWRNKALALTLSGALALSASCSSGDRQTRSTSSSTAPTTLAPPIPSVTEQQCIEPTAADIDAVQALLAAPENPDARVPLPGGKGGGPETLHRQEDFLKQQALAEGLTIYDGQPLIDLL